MFKSLHPNIRLRLYVTFINRLTSSMIFPFIAIYFTQKLGAVTAGVLLIIQVFIEIISSFFGGYLADQIGRKRVMVIGEWLNFIAFLGIAFANSPYYTSAWSTFFMLLLIGISTGLINPAAEAMLIDVSTEETRTYMYSINYWTRNFSLLLGLMIGGWFFKTHLFALLIALAAMSLITLLITTILIQETNIQVSNNSSQKGYSLKEILSSYKEVILDIPFIWYTLGGIAIYAIECQRVNFISVRMEQEIHQHTYHLFGLFSFPLDGVKLISLLTIENTLLVVLLVSLSAKIIRKYSEQSVMYVGFILFGLGYAFLAFSNHIVGLLIAVVILTIGEIMYIPTRQTILASIINNAKRGSYMAINGLVFQFGSLFGALGIIIGSVIGGVGMGIVYLFFAIIAIFFSRLGIVKRHGHSKVIKENRSILKAR